MGEKAKEILVLSQLIQCRYQWTDYMDTILNTLSTNSDKNQDIDNFNVFFQLKYFLLYIWDIKYMNATQDFCI